MTHLVTFNDLEVYFEDTVEAERYLYGGDITVLTGALPKKIVLRNADTGEQLVYEALVDVYPDNSDNDGEQA